ncbi:MAG: hypothetical protein HKM02_07760 [Pseudomonadales bacterium]|nr:hypothetical protein [Pseudomonadales bacterium]
MCYFTIDELSESAKTRAIQYYRGFFQEQAAMLDNPLDYKSDHQVISEIKMRAIPFHANGTNVIC